MLRQIVRLVLPAVRYVYGCTVRDDARDSTEVASHSWILIGAKDPASKQAFIVQLSYSKSEKFERFRSFAGALCV